MVERRRWRIGTRMWALLGVLVLAACGPAESADAPAGEDVRSAEAEGPEAEGPEAAVTVAEGTRMTFRLTEELSTESHAAGDRFRAVLLHDVSGSDGAVAISEGAVATGVVTEARESPGPDDPAVLGIRLESVAVGGSARTLESTLVDHDLKTETKDSDRETAAKIAIGAAAGALLGKAIGDGTKAVVIGAGAGAAAGTALAISTRDGHAVLGEGSTVTVVLDQPLPAG